MTQSLPLTYPDLVCMQDLDPNASETTSDLQNLIQDVYHVLFELLGSNPDDPDRGVGIDQYLSGTLDDLQKATRIIEAQLGEDDRIDTISANITQNPTTDPFPVSIIIEIGVDGSIITLQYGWESAVGLTPINPAGGN